VSCVAFVTGRYARNVTSEATWLASGPMVGSFPQPGVFAPAGSGDIGLWARFEELFSSQWWFFVNPPEASRFLYSFNGVVRDEMTNAGIAGAEVRILDRHSTGRQATTNSVGVYQFDRILTGEVFSVRASKEGYESLTKTHRLEYPFNPANPPELDFVLRRL
jgi:Carboxypeptidase regulatory-like domain